MRWFGVTNREGLSILSWSTYTILLVATSNYTENKSGDLYMARVQLRYALDEVQRQMTLKGWLR